MRYPSDHLVRHQYARYERASSSLNLSLSHQATDRVNAALDCQFRHLTHKMSADISDIKVPSKCSDQTNLPVCLIKLRGFLAPLRHIGMAPLKDVAHEQLAIYALADDVGDGTAVFLLEDDAARRVMHYRLRVSGSRNLRIHQGDGTFRGNAEECWEDIEFRPSRTAHLFNPATIAVRRSSDELHLARDLQVPRGKRLLRENLAFGDSWDEVLCPSHFHLEALPDLRLGQGGRSAGLVDGCSVGDVEGNHFGDTEKSFN